MEFYTHSSTKICQKDDCQGDAKNKSRFLFSRDEFSLVLSRYIFDNDELGAY